MQYQNQGGQPGGHGQPAYGNPPPGHAGQAPVHAQQGQPFQAGGYQQPAQPGYAQPQNPYGQQQGYQQPGYPQPGHPGGYQQPGYAPPTYPQPGFGGATPFPIVGGVKTPMIIAGIWHALWLIPSFFLIFTVIFAWVPLLLILLIIFEFRLVGKLNGQTPPSHHRGGAQALGIIQIVCILGGDVVTAVCGIVTLCSLNKMQP